MEHIDDVHKVAETNQQAFLELIKTYEQYCEKANISFTENIDAIRKRISEWLDSLLTHYQGQVIAYQEILSQQKTFINSAQISKDNLEQLIEFRCLNSDSYQSKNEKIQQQLEINKQSFLGYSQKADFIYINNDFTLTNNSKKYKIIQGNNLLINFQPIKYL